MGSTPLTLENVPSRLRAMRAESGNPSFAEIARRITAQRNTTGWSVSRATVYDCFRDGRKRFDSELVIAIVRTLAADEATVREWESALEVMSRRLVAAAVVHVTDTVPQLTLPFVGRARELMQLTRQPSAHWIHAMGGAGKTTLAYQAARRAVSSGLVGGVVIADLRGHSPSGPPADPAAAVRAALRALGDKSKVISVTAAQRLLYDHLRDQRTLLVLDDAASYEQIDGILPATDGISVIVTSRVVPEGDAFRAIEVPPFAPYESLALLDAMAGRKVIERDPESAEALLSLAGHHPLTVSVTAARVAARSDWTLAEHLDLARTRRESLRIDEPIARSLDLSYEVLPEAAQRLLRALAEYPVDLLDDSCIEVIAEGLIEDVAEALAVLVRHSLLSLRENGGYGMHDLVRVYAADRALETDSASRRRAVAERLRQHVINRAWSARRALNRRRHAVGRMPRGPVQDVVVERPERFFTDSVDLLLHVALQMPNDTRPASVNMISEVMEDSLHNVGRTDDALALFHEALRMARRTGDAVGEMRALADLGATMTRVGDAMASDQYLDRIDEHVDGWEYEAALALNARGMNYLTQRRTREADESLHAALAAAEAKGDVWRQGLIWNNIAYLYLTTDDVDRAREALERSIAISEQCGDKTGVARGRVNLSKLLLDLDDFMLAEVEARKGLTEMEELGNVPGTIIALTNIATAVCWLGRYDESIELAERGIEIARDSGMQQPECELLITLGHAHKGRGHFTEARDAWEQAAQVAEPIGDVASQAELRELLEELDRHFHHDGPVSGTR